MLNWDLLWKMRLDGDVEGARREFAIASAMPTFQAEDLQVQIFRASLHRIDGKRLECDATLDRVLAQSQAIGAVLPFSYFFQRAIQFNLAGSYTEALDAYTQAICRAQAPFEKAHALFGLVATRDSLNVDASEELKKLLEVTCALPQEEPGLRTVRSQLRAYRARRFFRAGNFGALMHEVPAELELDNAQMLRLWCEALPYHRYATAAPRITLSERTFFYQQSYRTRTLLGILHPQDRPSRDGLGSRTEFHPSDFCSRVYLWTWKWLENPQEFSVERIAALLSDELGQESDRCRILSSLPQDSAHLLKNALRWLALFPSSSQRWLRGVIGEVQVSGRNPAALLNYEALILSLLEAKRDGLEAESADYLQVVRAHELSQNPDLRLASLVLPQTRDFSMPTALTRLKESLRGFDTVQALVPGVLRINPITHSLAFDEQIIVSEPMVRAIEIWKRHAEVDCARFAREVFGLNSYEAFIHLPKINNLIQRVKAIFRTLGKPLSISTRGELILVDTRHFDEVRVENPPLHAKILLESSRWSELGASNRYVERTQQLKTPENAPILGELLRRESITREEIEKLTGKSRATSNRWIVQWIREGVLVKSGKSKSTIYRVSSRMGGQK